MIGTVLQIVGVACLVLGAFLVSSVVGFVVLGAALVAAGYMVEVEEVRRGSSSSG